MRNPRRQRTPHGRKKRHSRTVVPVDDEAVPDRGPANARSAGPLVRRAGRAEVTQVPARTVSRRSVPKAAPLHCVRLYSRPHIDLLRVAGALCCS
ncbi:putative leader peptide [Streptomyces umbrinus]|uniref:putative leader peptide n=1 Tax=Streptomyces umbrinus TaxID=67370 RepID=UPI0035711E79